MDKSFQMSLVLRGHEAMLEFGAKIGRNLKGGEIIELASDLGGGKTTLVKGLAQGAGSHDHVSSPSFTIRNDYQAKDISLAHFDFYRLNEPGILREMLAEAMIDTETAVIIEWAGIVDDVLPANRVKVKITAISSEERKVDIDCPEHFSYLFAGVNQ